MRHVNGYCNIISSRYNKRKSYMFCRNIVKYTENNTD